MGKIEEAIKKINEEVQKDPTNQYLALVGEHIIDRITTEAAAASVLAEDKTLAGVMRQIEAEAKKRSRGNCAVIADDIVYRWARDYFGLSETANPQSPAGKGICLSLEDFL